MDCSIIDFLSSAVNLDGNLSTNASKSPLSNVILLETCNYSNYIFNVLSKLMWHTIKPMKINSNLKMLKAREIEKI